MYNFTSRLNKNTGAHNLHYFPYHNQFSVCVGFSIWAILLEDLPDNFCMYYLFVYITIHNLFGHMISIHHIFCFPYYFGTWTDGF